MTLEALQQRMWRVLVGDAPLLEAAGLVKGGAVSIDERVGLYAEMYWLRLRDVLRTEFPHVRAVLGDEDFDVLAAKYVKAHPSTHFSLDWFGQHLEPFLRTNPVSGAPFLADLAALEFARSQSFIAADSPVATADDLMKVTPEKAGTARFTLTPSVRVLSLSNDVRALLRGETDMPAGSIELVVFRKGFDVFHDAVSAEEATALRLAVRGATLPEVCDAFVACGDEAAAKAFQAIASWVNEGLVARIEV